MTSPTWMNRRLAAAAAAPLMAVGLAACGTTVSTAGFKGEQHAVAKRLADFQSHAGSRENDKICSQDVTAELRQRLGGKNGCEKAFKRQLEQTDSSELSVQSVTIAPGGKTATAGVKSTAAGKKNVPGTIRLAKEGNGWRIALQPG
jgi:hypothetical protein